MWVRLRNKLQCLFRRDSFERELAEEMDFHRQMLELEKTRQGLASEAAGVSARRQLGNTTLACEYSRERRLNSSASIPRQLRTSIFRCTPMNCWELPISSAFGPSGTTSPSLGSGPVESSEKRQAQG